MSLNRGEEVQGQMSSTNASSGSLTLSYFTPGGNARTLAANESLLVTDFTILTAAAGAFYINAVQLSNTTNAMSLVAGTSSVNGGVSRSMNTPFTVPGGWVLWVLAASGQVNVQITGAIVQ